MRLAQLRVNDLVDVDIRGRQFRAVITALPADCFERASIDPVHPGNGWRSCRLSQIKRRVARPQSQVDGIQVPLTGWGSR